MQTKITTYAFLLRFVQNFVSLKRDELQSKDAKKKPTAI